MTYLLDTSIFINGWRKHYHPEVFPAYWSALDALIENRKVLSCEAVYDELQQQRDELADWAKERKRIFRSPTEDTLLELQGVMREFPNFAAQGGSRNAADPYLIAHARISKAVVVTDEVKLPAVRLTKPPKIPNVCDALGIRWMPGVDFLRANNIVFREI